MAIKDIPGPGFVGTTTIKWIVTRGFSIGAAPVVTPADVFYAVKGISGLSVGVRGATSLSVPAKGISGLSVAVKGDQ